MTEGPDEEGGRNDAGWKWLRTLRSRLPLRQEALP